MSLQQNAAELMLIMTIGPLPDALEPGIHCARTHWIRGFIAFGLARLARRARNMRESCHHQYLTGTAGGRLMDRRTARNPGSMAWAGRGTRVPVRRAVLPHRGGGAAAVLGTWAAR
jgi:hypothetical protein